MTEFNKEVGYGGNTDDFVIDGEITVKITLSEYRDLVKNKAISDKLVAIAEVEKYERNSENDRLRKENEALKAEMFEMQKTISKPLEDGGSEAEDESDEG